MDSSLTRRDALKGIISAGTVACVQPATALQPDSPITLPSGHVEISLTTISPQTVRITVQSIAGGELLPLAADGALQTESPGHLVARVRSLFGTRKIGRAHV